MLILELRLGPWTRTLATQLAASLSDSDQAPGRIQVSDPNVSLGAVTGCPACSWPGPGLGLLHWQYILVVLRLFALYHLDLQALIRTVS